MIIVGVGAGPKMLTQEAIEAIEKAHLIYGSSRALELVLEHIKPGCEANAIEDWKRLKELPEDALVLSTGDPMLSGLGYLSGKVIPGISSLQVACARMKISLLKVVPITAHGRKLDPQVVAFELERGKIVFLLIDETYNLEELCRYLEKQKISRPVTVFISLGYPEETIIRGTTSLPPKALGLSCVLIGN